MVSHASTCFRAEELTEWNRHAAISSQASKCGTHDSRSPDVNSKCTDELYARFRHSSVFQRSNCPYSRCPSRCKIRRSPFMSSGEYYRWSRPRNWDTIDPSKSMACHLVAIIHPGYLACKRNDGSTRRNFSSQGIDPNDEHPRVQYQRTCRILLMLAPLNFSFLFTQWSVVVLPASEASSGSINAARFKPLLAVPIEIATVYRRGPRPVSYAPLIAQV